MTQAIKPENYNSRVEQVGEWKIRVTSYKLGDKYHVTVDNVDPGAALARSEGATIEEAESKALEKARAMVSKTRVFA